MFRDLMLPTPRTKSEVNNMPDFVHPYHRVAEGIKMQPDFAQQVVARLGWDNDQLALLKATKFLYLNGVDLVEDRQKIKEILELVRPDNKENSLKRFSITGKQKGNELMEITLKKGFLHALDPVGFSFYTAATTDEPRNALMEVETVLVRGTSRSEYLPAFRDLMRIAFDYFKSSGIDVPRFNAAWDPDYYGATNYKGYKDAIREGKSSEEAAWSTRTGVILRSFGFNKVEVPPYDESVGINALFSR